MIMNCEGSVAHGTNLHVDQRGISVQRTPSEKAREISCKKIKRLYTKDFNLFANLD